MLSGSQEEPWVVLHGGKLHTVLCNLQEFENSIEYFYYQLRKGAPMYFLLPLNWLSSVRSVLFQHTAGQTHQIDCKTLWNALNLWRGDPSRENTAKKSIMLQNEGKILIKKWIVIFPDFFFIFPNFENKIRKKNSEISEFLEKTKNEKKRYGGSPLPES